MTEPTAGPPGELPSSQRLLRSTVIAMATAGVLLVVAVLPAEYGVDPSGIGNVLGLTEMGKIKQQLAQEAEAPAPATAPEQLTQAAQPTQPAQAAAPLDSRQVAAPTTAVTQRSDSVQVVLVAGQGKEIKLAMQKGARVTYVWSTDNGGVNFETHGDTLNAPSGDFHSYGKGRNARADSGAFVAVFNGMHGWYWRNRTSGPVTVTLKTSGAYQELKRLN